MSSLFCQDFNVGNIQMSWTLPPAGCTKVDVDSSKRYITLFTTLGFVRKDMDGGIVKQEGKHIGDYSILLTERLTIREALMMAIKKNLH